MDSCLWVEEAAPVTHSITRGFKGWVSFMAHVGEGECEGEVMGWVREGLSGRGGCCSGGGVWK